MIVHEGTSMKNKGDQWGNDTSHHRKMVQSYMDSDKTMSNFVSVQPESFQYVVRLRLTRFQAQHWSSLIPHLSELRCPAVQQLLCRFDRLQGGPKVEAQCNSVAEILVLINVTFRTADTTDSTNTTILCFQCSAAVVCSLGYSAKLHCCKGCN